MNRTYDQMTQALSDQGLTAALAVLNSRVPQRFSAVYRLAGGNLINVAFIDKLAEPLPDHLMSVPDLAVHEFHSPKATSNLCFAVPLVSIEGKRVGTICHFDTVSKPLPDEDFELLHLAACVFLTSLPR
ncbi:MAG: hypothetical protein EON54_25900 [Alcaligenaceae bacterium]|nr:MAG: hypothetical protein EON54_25900 [Alcaligenaceae bacterium]